MDKRIDMLDQAFLATCNAYSAALEASGSAEVAMLVRKVRDATLASVTERMPAPVKLLEALLGEHSREARRDLVRECAELDLSGGVGDATHTPCPAASLVAAATQVIDDMEDKAQGERIGIGQGRNARAMERDGGDWGRRVCPSWTVIVSAVPDRRLLAKLCLVREDARAVDRTMHAEGRYGDSDGKAPCDVFPPSLPRLEVALLSMVTLGSGQRLQRAQALFAWAPSVSQHAAQYAPHSGAACDNTSVHKWPADATDGKAWDAE